MVQVHVVTRENAAQYAKELDSYFRWRHLIYVEERGWEDLRREDGLERDQFDTSAAVHLIAMIGPDVVGGSRMIRMSEPTLLSEVFPRLVQRGTVPRDHETIEWTRMFVAPARRTGHGEKSVAGALFCAVMEYCLAIGATRVGGVMETFWLPRWQRFGWTTQALGLPEEIAGSMTLAAFMDVNRKSLDGVRDATGWTQPVLVWGMEPGDAHATALTLLAS
ncbi:acyl-homoserine-lactone synthase [Microvirga lenta]|uniref:acyl-homoserine-lactone synthase n=1 Tax=Microvirga lenta TaxID=2881337 RepID=UPI001D0018DA|nr:acyl-homoserine-lactone synthase [Microvirga lenta]MCB5174801.1 GNAT family N-acetyltransferase [Microvirga lenta]